MKTVGIIGFGSFGKFLAEKLSSYAIVKVYSASNTQNSWATTLEDVAQSDFVIPAIPLHSYETVLTQLAPLLNKESVVVDICSVKVKPQQLLAEYLGDQPVILTHPMFGPESASVSFQGHTMVLCPEGSTAQDYDDVKSFLESLELKLIEMSAEEHDREIAIVQGLTFFIARAVNETGVHNQKLHTPSFQRLLNLAELEKHHSLELFETIQKGNPYAAAVRKEFLEAAQTIDAEL